MFYNKKITMFGHEIYCRDNNRYMTLPHKQVVTKSGFIFNLPNPETGNYSAPPMGMSNRLTVVLQQELH